MPVSEICHQSAVLFWAVVCLSRLTDYTTRAIQPMLAIISHKPRMKAYLHKLLQLLRSVFHSNKLIDVSPTKVSYPPFADISALQDGNTCSPTKSAPHFQIRTMPTSVTSNLQDASKWPPSAGPTPLHCPRNPPVAKANTSFGLLR